MRVGSLPEYSELSVDDDEDSDELENEGRRACVGRDPHSGSDLCKSGGVLSCNDGVIAEPNWGLCSSVSSTQ